MENGAFAPLEIWKMEHLLFWSKCSIFHIFKSIQNFSLIFFLEFFQFCLKKKMMSCSKIAYGVPVTEESLSTQNTDKMLRVFCTVS